MKAHSLSICSKTFSRIAGTWVWCAFFFLVSELPLQGQNAVTFEAQIGVKEAVVGVPFELSFTLKNAEGSRFSPPSLAGFKSGGFSEMRGMSIVNGHSSSSQSWTIELEANKPGVYTIGPATVLANGRSMTTAPISIKVSAAASSSKGNVSLPPGSDDRIFIAAEFDRNEVYTGQQVAWRIQLYTQISVDGYDIIALPEFDGFYFKEKIRYDKRTDYRTIRGKKYAVRTLHEEALFPQETGDLTIGAARVSVGIEQSGAQGFLFGPRPVSLQTQPVHLTVKPLPTSAPAGFTGGTGHYTWEVKADTNLLTTDDALTLTVEVKGNGDARRFAPPKIIVPAGCEIFEPRILEEEEYESENEILHRKKYEYVVLPKDIGDQVIAPELVYFDPDSNKYVTLRANPVSITVKEGKNYKSRRDSTGLEPKVLPVSNQSGFWKPMVSFLQGPALWALGFLLMILLGIFLVKRRNSNPPIASKQSIPQPVAQPDPMVAARQRFTQVARLLQENNPALFYDELFKSIQGWLSARLHLTPSQLNQSEISNRLRERGASAIRIQALLSVWHTCEQAIYGAQMQGEQMESTWHMAEQILNELEKELK